MFVKRNPAPFFCSPNLERMSIFNQNTDGPHMKCGPSA